MGRRPRGPAPSTRPCSDVAYVTVYFARTLILHGDDDQIVPIDESAKLSVKLVKNAKLEVYPGAPHGMCSTEKDKVNADLLEFIRS